MNLNDYFDPVSLERPEFSHLKAESTISRSITIHTPDTPVSNIQKYDIAIFGVREDRKAITRGSAATPDLVREKLYLLGNGHKKLKIIDLGNLKNAGTIDDTYYALRDILTVLIENSVTSVIIGGSQDLGLGLARAYDDFQGFWNFTTIDSRLDFGYDSKKLHSGNYLDELMRSKNSGKLNIVNLGHQLYFTPLSLIDKFENKGHSSIRLGTLRASLQIAEPVLRDSHILSVDLNAVKQPDAPAGSSPSPNGLFGHELCQLTRYAGASANLRAILFSEVIPEKDLNDLSTHLIAQAIWYFIDGYSIRQIEDPSKKGIKKFIVSASVADQNMVFYRSNATERWWMELPVKDPATGKKYIVSCGYEDYQKACTNEIPDRWWKLMKRFS
jgi:arginase family enzyme